MSIAELSCAHRTACAKSFPGQHGTAAWVAQCGAQKEFWDFQGLGYGWHVRGQVRLRRLAVRRKEAALAQQYAALFEQWRAYLQSAPCSFYTADIPPALIKPGAPG